MLAQCCILSGVGILFPYLLSLISINPFCYLRIYSIIPNSRLEHFVGGYIIFLAPIQDKRVNEKEKNKEFYIRKTSREFQTVFFFLYFSVEVKSNGGLSHGLSPQTIFSMLTLC